MGRRVLQSLVLIGITLALGSACQYGFSNYVYSGKQWRTINARENDQDTCKAIGACQVKLNILGQPTDECVVSTIGFWRGPARIGTDGKLIGWITKKDRGTCGIHFRCWDTPEAPYGIGMNTRGPIPTPAVPKCDQEED